MARVYRAQHRALRKAVAIKIMAGPLLQRPHWRQRFVREGQAAAAVTHPNIVDITDVGVWEGQPYLVMELLHGEDLEQYLRRQGRLSEAEAASLLIPIIAGLSMAHACGVVHRDLKPSNVFLARGPGGQIVPKLLDFGISKWGEGSDIDVASTPHGELMGSPMYMSPEAVRGARDLTPQSDQYSLGVILYECVTGRTPFEEDSLLAVLEAVARGQVEPPRHHCPDLSSTMEEVILRALQPEPCLRFAGVHELGRALCQCADQRTRLLWLSSFGLTEGAEGAPSAASGSITQRVGTPVSLLPSATGRARWRRFAPALGALGLAALVYAGWQRLPLARLTGGAATVHALQPPAASLAARLPLDGASGELPLPARTLAAPDSLPSALPVSPVPPPPSAIAAAPVTARPEPLPVALPPQRSPGAAAQRTVPPRALPPRALLPRASTPRFAVPPETARSTVPTSAPSPRRKETAFGANRSPLLD
jgi:serine/threonine-protein kinase